MLTVDAADKVWRIYDDDCRLAEVARTTTKRIARFKVHNPNYHADDAQQQRRSPDRPRPGSPGNAR
jgi:hypothetical protein